jgi:hypothetical protein
MRVIILIISIFILIKEISYAVYEYKANYNKAGAISVVALSLIAVILPNIFIWIRY